MYIRRKAFSLLNVEGEKRLFSVNEITLENLKEKIFSFNEEEKNFSEKKKKIPLREIESHKGIKRAILTAIPTGGGSLVGGYLAKDEANRADEEGADDKEIIRRARDRGLKAGAITGGAIGTLGFIRNTLRNNKLAAALSIPVAASLGALGGRNAAGVNTKARLKKRNKEED